MTAEFTAPKSPAIDVRLGDQRRFQKSLTNETQSSEPRFTARGVSLIGARVPDVQLAELKDSKVDLISSQELFKGRRVVLFALPGAFTPTCSNEHVPGYVELAPELRREAISEIICLSVNDAFVMQAWQQQEKAETLHFVADPYAEFTLRMGMVTNNREASLGVRSRRYSMLVDDGVIEAMFVERDAPGDPFEVSDAETMLKYLRPTYEDGNAVFMFARHGCPHCARAKSLLRNKGISFEAVHLGETLTKRGVKAACGTTSVPQVFIDGKRIGGADQLEEYFEANGQQQASY